MNLFKGFSRSVLSAMVICTAVWTAGCADPSGDGKTDAKTEAKGDAKTEAKDGEQKEAGSSKNDGETKLPSES